jgi:hypothetical protein
VSGGGRSKAKLSRRRFVALAGVAALSAAGPPSVLGPAPALAATEPVGAPDREAAGSAAATRPKKPGPSGAEPVKATTVPAPAPSPHQKEFERQKAGTLATLKTIRAYPLPPGGELPVVFRPMRTPKKGR